MCPVSIKDVLPSLGTTHDIAAIQLHEDIGLSRSLRIIERSARRPALSLSQASMSSSAMASLLRRRGMLLLCF